MGGGGGLLCVHFSGKNEEGYVHMYVRNILPDETSVIYICNVYARTTCFVGVRKVHHLIRYVCSLLVILSRQGSRVLCCFT